MQKMVANCRTPYGNAGEVFEMTADEIREEGGNIEFYLDNGVLEIVTGVETGTVMPVETRDEPPVTGDIAAGEPETPVGGPGSEDETAATGAESGKKN